MLPDPSWGLKKQNKKKKKKQEGHDGPVLLHWLMCKILS